MKIATDYVSSQTQSTPKHIAEFAEVAKKAQLETIDLMMKAGKRCPGRAYQCDKESFFSERVDFT